MYKVSNKAVAATTCASWLLIAAIAAVNGYMYGVPALDSVVPGWAMSFISWVAFLLTAFSVYRLYKSE